MHSIILLENDAVIRSSISDVVNGIQTLELVGTSSTLSGGFELLKKRPDFALVDLMLDDGMAFDFIAEAVSKHSTKILIVSVLGDEESVISAVEAGAAGYITKDASAQEMQNAIGAILRGETPMSPTIARHLLRRIQSVSADHGSEPNEAKQSLLSPRERQVLEALAFGMNYKEVARKYDLSHHTVAKYIKTIYKKLSVNSRAEAVVEGLRFGIISMQKKP